MLNPTTVLCLTAISFTCFSCSPSRAHLKNQTYPVEITTTTKGGLYKVVDTDQKEFFNNSRIISKPSEDQHFYGQDAQHLMNTPSYAANGDGTITDQVTGLMWQKAYKVMTYEEAVDKDKNIQFGKSYGLAYSNHKRIVFLNVVQWGGCK